MVEFVIIYIILYCTKETERNTHVKKSTQNKKGTMENVILHEKRKLAVYYASYSNDNKNSLGFKIETISLISPKCLMVVIMMVATAFGSYTCFFNIL